MTRRVNQSIEGAGRPRLTGASPHGGSGNVSGRRRRAPVVRLLALAVALGAIAIAAAPAQAFTFSNPVSHHVALIPSNGVGEPHYGNMPTSSFVTGFPAKSFNQFSFTDVPLAAITTGTLSQAAATLSHYDTVALIQVQTSALTGPAKTALAQFVANGGKLLIHDADETSGNDYSWLFPGSLFTTHVGAGCAPTCGARNGSSAINSNSTLISNSPADPSYVNVLPAPALNSLATFTDAIGDSNLLVTMPGDPHWFTLATGTNALKERGAQVAYAANNNGLIVYNGFDTDFIKQLASDPFQSDCTVSFPCPGFAPGTTVSTDWLAQMWYSELLKGWGTPPGTSVGGVTGGGAGLPQNKPLAAVGTPLAAGKAGLPSNRLCVPGRRLALALRKLAHLHGRKVVRVDVFVNGKLARTERRHFRNITLKHLPRHGTYTVEVIATTKRGYLLIAHRRYHGC